VKRIDEPQKREDCVCPRTTASNLMILQSRIAKILKDVDLILKLIIVNPTVLSTLA
jgi:hypothetical protein